MKTSEQLDLIGPALAAALGDMRDVVKSAQGYGYKYAALDQLTSMARPVLAAHGLAALQEATATESGACVTTRLLHASGQWIETEPLPMVVEAKKGLSVAQNLGAVLTYARRYQLQALLGIAAEEDTDARRDDNGKAETVGDAMLGQIRDALLAASIPEAKVAGAYGLRNLADLPAAKGAEVLAKALAKIPGKEAA